ncbi:PIN domain-like protein [Irpex rosettiformis]|uniref:PIN domain-like protein n=1 Tax=Irpex rosettiformis TaxID=378272 RepID=A0ACB8U7Q0_9APHY|nr:PIN domain-like protein [Irpex rosettiformis]
MGVLGLNPFLQKVCPDVFKSFPNRLKDFNGKTIVFDGTLITQRLHFAPTPHPHRHVLGWYRIIQELKESSVLAVCVFDGKSRNVAKQREVNRRREERRTIATRGMLEKQRLVRLQRLPPVVQALNSLTGEARMGIIGELRPVFQEAPRFIPTESPSSALSSTVFLDLEEHTLVNLEEHTLVKLEEHIPQSDIYNSIYGDFQDSDLSEIITGEPCVAACTPPLDYMEPEYFLDVLPEHGPCLDYADCWRDGDAPSLIAEENISRLEELFSPVDADESLVPSIEQTSDSSIGGIKSVLTNLFSAFKENLGILTSISHVDTTPPSTSADESVEGQAYNTISKAQQELTDAEGSFWQHLCETDPVSLHTAESEALSLLQKSSILVESYDRRTQPPTAATYEESKEILCAMGVPCIETNGPYEAEAVAAAMVVQGQADYVASEDTDVLVYGAPLVRNISMKTEPLVVVSGTEVWDSLQLDQSQFIDFAVLLGTDFSQRIKNIGPTRALKFIREYGSIERIIESETRYSPRLPIDLYLEQVSLARLIFQTLPPVPSEKLTPLPADEMAIHAIMHKYRLWRALSEEHQWTNGFPLSGNYFSDSPFSQ